MVEYHLNTSRRTLTRTLGTAKIRSRIVGFITRASLERRWTGPGQGFAELWTATMSGRTIYAIRSRGSELLIESSPGAAWACFDAAVERNEAPRFNNERIAQ